MLVFSSSSRPAVVDANLYECALDDSSRLLVFQLCSIAACTVSDAWINESECWFFGANSGVSGVVS